jgi:hypothetical protein
MDHAQKHDPSIVAWHRPHEEHVSHVRLWVHWSVTITGHGADDIENNLIHCRVLDCDCRAVAWQQVDQIHYNINAIIALFNPYLTKSDKKRNIRLQPTSRNNDHFSLHHST